MESMNKQLLVVTIIALQRMDNNTLAAANNALTGFGKIGRGCLAFEPMKDAALIREDGRPADNETLLAGLSFEINRRVEAGTFV